MGKPGGVGLLFCSGWSLKAALMVCMEQGVRGCTMQVTEGRALQAEETGSAKVLSTLMCSGNGWVPA